MIAMGNIDLLFDWKRNAYDCLGKYRLVKPFNNKNTFSFWLVEQFVKAFYNETRKQSPLKDDDGNKFQENIVI